MVNDKQHFFVTFLKKRLFFIWRLKNVTKNDEWKKVMSLKFTLTGDGPLTRGGGARFLGLARGSSSWFAGPACLAKFRSAAAKLRLFCWVAGPGPGPDVWAWGRTPVVGLCDLPIGGGCALVLVVCKPITNNQTNSL